MSRIKIQLHKGDITKFEADDIVNALIAAKANVDAADKYGWTPLYYAANDKIRAILKEAGAKY